MFLRKKAPERLVAVEVAPCHAPSHPDEEREEDIFTERMRAEREEGEQTARTELIGGETASFVPVSDAQNE